MNTHTILENLTNRYPYQPLFLQTATEILESLSGYLEEHGATEADYARLARLLTPERIISFRVTWEDDAGILQHNLGYRVQFSSVLGPYKGGLRFDPTVTEDTLKFLGLEQIFKNALTGLPLGGGKGGSDFDPKGKSDAEVRRFSYAFMMALHRHIGPNTDVPAGDIGVGGREVGFLYGAYKQIMNRSEGAMTGKGVGFGGSCGRIEATGHGVVYFAAEMLGYAGDTLGGKRAVVSGSGNVATYTALKLIEKGAAVLTVSDRGGYLHKDAGFSEADIHAIAQHKQTGAQLSECVIDGAAHHEGQPWGVAANLYFPCATQNEIDGAAAEQIVSHGARAVIEGANMPSTIEAMRVLVNAGVLFGPSKAANAGGVAVSGLEMSQNASHYQWKCEDVDEELRAIMRHIHTECVRNGEQADGSINYVHGANIAGFKRVFGAMKELGW